MKFRNRNKSSDYIHIMHFSFEISLLSHELLSMYMTQFVLGGMVRGSLFCLARLEIRQNQIKIQWSSYKAKLEKMR